MHSRSLLTYLITVSCATGISRGAMVKEGANIEEVNRAMAEAGYSETALAMGTKDRSHRLAFWSVDDGVLIVRYSSKSKQVVSVSFWLSDERPKAMRKTFSLRVESFDTDSGAMVVQTNPPKREQAGNGQPATAPKSKSEGAQKPQPEAEGRSR